MNESRATEMMDHGAAGVSVIVPAYNEEPHVGDQVREISNVLNGESIDHEVIVVDDGSADGTAELAADSDARVLRHPENRGYGASIKSGISQALFNTIVIIDADGTYPTDEIPAILARLRDADMVVGARTGGNVSVPFVRRPAKWFLRVLATQIASRPIPDLNSGLRAFRRDCVSQYFPILSNRFSFTTTLTLALLADDYRVVYHPIDYFARIGSSKIRARHFTDFILLILRMSMIFQPLRIFTPLALAVGGAGILKAIYDVIALFQRSSAQGLELLYEPVLSTSAILMVSMGLQLLLIGMIADGVIRRLAHNNGPQPSSKALVEFQPPTGLEAEIPRQKIPANPE